MDFAAVLYALAESEQRTVSRSITGAKAASIEAAVGTEGRISMRLRREPLETAVRTATCSFEIPRLPAGEPLECAKRGIPTFNPL